MPGDVAEVQVGGPDVHGVYPAPVAAVVDEDRPKPVGAMFRPATSTEAASARRCDMMSVAPGFPNALALRYNGLMPGVDATISTPDGTCPASLHPTPYWSTRSGAAAVTSTSARRASLSPTG